MGGRFGKYGDLKRKDALRKSLKEKGRLQKDIVSRQKTREKEFQMSEGNRSEITQGTRVLVVQKQDQRTGKLIEGIVQDILTKSSTHPHGIKVRLTNGVVGRVKRILEI
jgi:uncharacterized repeat protein (TIGR03833 family)